MKATDSIPDWVIDWLQEPSSWRGIILVAGGAGIVIKPEYHEPITAVGFLAVGVINILKRGQKWQHRHNKKRLVKLQEKAQNQSRKAMLKLTSSKKGK